MQNKNTSVIELPPLTEPGAWDAPVLFDEFDTPEIPAHFLPSVLADFAAALSLASETSTALSVMTILGVLSCTLSKRFFISPRAGWLEPINIYSLIALPPANHKSLVLSSCTKPLILWEQAQTIQKDAEVKKQVSALKTQERIIDGLRNKAAKTHDKLARMQLIDEIAALETALPQMPVLPVLFINDATPESLASLIYSQGGRLAIFSDEGGIMETLAGLYSNGAANIDILLKGIDGGEVRIHRKDRSIILNPYLTILLAVQPTIIQNMSEKRAYVGSGVLERFLYVLPRSHLGYRTHNKPPVSESIENAYHAKITSLLHQFAENNNLSTILTLSASAHQAWRDFQDYIEMQLGPEGMLAICPGWGGKICGFALRIAGLLHVAEFETSSLVINESTMKNALSIANLLTQHAVAAFNLMGIDLSIEDAKAVLQWIRTNASIAFRQTELVLAMRNRKLGKPERLVKALRVLYQRNIISSGIKITTTRKPTTIYHVNPRLFSKI